MHITTQTGSWLFLWKQFENITDGWFSHINNLSALYKPDNRTENKVFITFPPAWDDLLPTFYERNLISKGMKLHIIVTRAWMLCGFINSCLKFLDIKFEMTINCWQAACVNRKPKHQPALLMLHNWPPLTPS